jgi:hypothetical protein
MPTWIQFHDVEQPGLPRILAQVQKSRNPGNEYESLVWTREDGLEFRDAIGRPSLAEAKSRAEAMLKESPTLHECGPSCPPRWFPGSE